METLISGIPFTMVIPMILAVLIVGGIGWFLWYQNNDIDKHRMPFVLKMRKALKKNDPVLILSHPSSNHADAYIGYRDKKGSPVFDLEEAVGLKFTPEACGNIRALRLNDVEIYFGCYIFPELFSQENILALNRLGRIRDKFPKLRFMTNQQLHAIIDTPACYWSDDCAKLMRTAESKHTPWDHMPESVEEFVKLIGEVRKMISLEPLYKADYIGEKWEYVEVTKETTSISSKIPLPTGFLSKFKKTPKTVSSTDESAGVIYKQGYRIPIGIQLYCHEDAFKTISSGVTSKHMEEYGAAIELRTRNEMKNKYDDWMEKLFKILVPCGIFAVLAAIAVFIIQSGTIPGT
jgi:hypothetical protein